MTDTATRQTRPATEVAALSLTDVDGDRLTARATVRRNGPAVYVDTARHGVELPYSEVFTLHAFLGRWLAKHGPQPAEDDGDEASYAWPANTLGEWHTILDEAKAAVYGDRNHHYGHPREDFTRTAVMWQGLLLHKLADGEHMTPEDVARCLIAVKLARDVHAPKRDNRVDMAGYALCLDRLETGQ